MTIKERNKFRATKEWKEFRLKVAKLQDNKDYITGKKLLKGYQLHHLDLNKDNYDDISDMSHFIAINKSTHDVLHTLYRYDKDRDICKRYNVVLDMMHKINDDY